jgi:hypothetical protein
MRCMAIALCGIAIGLVGGPLPSGMAQSTGPAADKIDTNPVNAGKTDAQPAPSAPPDTAPAMPQERQPPVPAPPQEQAQKPADTTAAGQTVETVGQGQAIAVLGRKVVGPDGKAPLGSVIDMLVDGDGKPRAAVIDFGGFLGVGSRHVAIDWNLLKFRLGDQDAPVQLDLDPAEIKAAPEYKEVDAKAEVVEPTLTPPTPLPALAPLSELPLLPQLAPARTHAIKNAGQ